MSEDAAFALALSQMCSNEPCARQKNPGYELCSDCFCSIYGRRCACSRRINLEMAMFTCEVCLEEEDDVPPEDATYAEMKEWEDRRNAEDLGDPIFTTLASSLPTCKATTTDIQSTCCICLDTYKEGDTITTFACSTHRFHDECIKIWFTQNKSSCPVCLFDMRGD